MAVKQMCVMCRDYFTPTNLRAMPYYRDYHKAKMVCNECHRRYTVSCAGGCGVELFRVHLSPRESNFRIKISRDGKVYCETCYEKIGSALCPYCHTDIVESRDWSFATGIRPICKSCYDENVLFMQEDDYDDENPLFPYFHRAGANDPGIPFCGVELETDEYSSINTAYRRLKPLRQKDKIPTFWLKSDGSLNDGIEICFHPRSELSWKAFMQDSFLAIKSIVEEAGGRAYNTQTCGLHIHRDKTDITPLTSTKLAFFFGANRRHLEKIAQRKDNGYCSFNQYVPAKAVTTYKRHKNGHYANRGCLAMDTYHNTHEFRLFRGTLAPRTILAQIGFVNGLIRFLQGHLMSELRAMKEHKGAQWDALMRWFQTYDSPLTEDVHAFLCRKRYYTISPREKHVCVL